MFEDSTFESTGKLRTRSRGWMIATFVFNASILLALILIPLIYPEALPNFSTIVLLEAPTPPPEQPKPVARPEHAPAAQRQIQGGVAQAPSKIPKRFTFLMPRSRPRPTQWPFSGTADQGQAVLPSPARARVRSSAKLSKSSTSPRALWKEC